MGPTALNNEFFTKACVEWRERLADGKLITHLIDPGDHWLENCVTVKKRYYANELVVLFYSQSLSLLLHRFTHKKNHWGGI